MKVIPKNHRDRHYYRCPHCRAADVIWMGDDRQNKQEVYECPKCGRRTYDGELSREQGRRFLAD